MKLQESRVLGMLTRRDIDCTSSTSVANLKRGSDRELKLSTLIRGALAAPAPGCH